MRQTISLVLVATALVCAGPSYAIEATPLLPGDGINIREATLSQIYRYAREMYRYGNYPESIKAFKEMLSIDCNSKVARYHLIKIAKKSPQYAELNSYLQSLPCPASNFTEEDFLPASLYYLSDAELMQEQLAFYNKRYRIAKESLQDAADNYGKLTKELEDEVGLLRNQTPSSDGVPSSASELNDKLITDRDAALRMDQEISGLKKQLLAERARYQRDIELMQKEPSLSTETATAEFSVNAELERRTIELAAKDEELSSLQKKFDDIQTRLRAIQRAVEDKNAAIKAMQAEVATATAMAPNTGDPQNAPSAQGITGNNLKR